MMKNNKGVTLTILLVMIILLMIITGIGLGATRITLSTYLDNQLEIELSVVRQLITEKYERARTVNKLKSDDPDFWIGEKIDVSHFQEIEFPEEVQVPDYQQPEYLEDYYYRLDKTALRKLGLQNSNNIYVVKYSTGEVYNESQKVNSVGEALYLGPIYTSNEAEEDTESFNDWNNE